MSEKPADTQPAPIVRPGRLRRRWPTARPNAERSAPIAPPESEDVQVARMVAAAVAGVGLIVGTLIWLRTRRREKVEQNDVSLSSITRPEPEPIARRGDDPIARAKELREKAKKNPSDVSVLLACARAHLECGRYGEAILDLQHAGRLSPANPQLRLELGRALIGVAEWEKAIQALDEACRLDGGLPEAHELRGHALAEKGWTPSGEIGPEAIACWRDALRLYRQRLEKHPADAEVRSRIGLLLLQVGEPEAGLSELRRAASERPMDLEIRLRLAGALRDQEREEEATREFVVAANMQMRIAKDNPNSAPQLARLGELLDEAELDGAIEALRDAAMIDPAYGDIAVALVERGGAAEEAFLDGVSALHKGSWGAAETALVVALEEVPVHAHAYYGLAIALSHLGRLEQARKSVAQALAYRPGWDRALELRRELAAAASITSQPKDS